jgi:tripartite-type tricarboxylate transporter receptor subunit TctC
MAGSPVDASGGLGRCLRRALCGAALVAAPLLAEPPATAPGAAPGESGLTFIVPADENGSSDVVARIVERELARVTGMRVATRHIGGAEGVPGTNAIAAAPKDGHTIGLGVSTPMTGGMLLSTLDHYNPLEDFDWLAVLGAYPAAIVVRDARGPASFAQWLDDARQAQKPLRYGTAGYASAARFAGEFLRIEEHANLVHVRFTAARDVYAALAAGEIDVAVDGLPAALAATRAAPARPLRIIAVSSAKRSALLPDVPAFGEQWPDREFLLWAAIIAPAHLPSAVRTALAGQMRALLADRAFIAELAGTGMTWLGLDNDAATQFVRDDLVRKAREVAQYGIQPIEPGKAPGSP